MSRELILPALLRASRTDGAIRLVEPNDSRSGGGLFPCAPGESALAIRESVPHLLQEDPRSPNQPRQVRLTDLGLETLLEGTPSEERTRLVEEASPLYQKSLYAKWSILIHRKGWSADQRGWAACGCRLAHHFHPTSAGKGASTDEAAPFPEANRDFLRSLAQELVMSWKHANHPEAREGIARAMRSVGLQQLGTGGQIVQFEGRYHVSETPLFPGDVGMIQQPGWLIHDGKGEYLLEKAIVVPR